MQKHIKDLEKIQARKQELQHKEKQIREVIVNTITQTLITTGAMDIDFHTLIGGILEVIDKTKQADKQTQVWKSRGETFCRVKKRRGKKTGSDAKTTQADKNSDQ